MWWLRGPMGDRSGGGAQGLESFGARIKARSTAPPIPPHPGSFPWWFSTPGSRSSSHDTHLQTHTTTPKAVGHYHPRAFRRTPRAPFYSSSYISVWMKPSVHGSPLCLWFPEARLMLLSSYWSKVKNGVTSCYCNSYTFMLCTIVQTIRCDC